MTAWGVTDDGVGVGAWAGLRYVVGERGATGGGHRRRRGRRGGAGVALRGRWVRCDGWRVPDERKEGRRCWPAWPTGWAGSGYLARLKHERGEGRKRAHLGFEMVLLCPDLSIPRSLACPHPHPFAPRPMPAPRPRPSPRPHPTSHGHARRPPCFDNA